MPNWCYNTLRLTGISDDIHKFYMENKNNDENITDGILDFSKSVPRPKKQEENWYDWNCSNWGTKWNAKNISSINGESYNFNTAWSPPDTWLINCSEKYPDIEFTLQYEEGGCGFFGIITVKNGEMLSEHNYELWDINEKCFEYLNNTCIKLIKNQFNNYFDTLYSLYILNYLPKDLNELICEFAPTLKDKYGCSKISKYPLNKELWNINENLSDKVNLLEEVLIKFRHIRFQFIDENIMEIMNLEDEFNGAEPYVQYDEFVQEEHLTNSFKENVFDEYFDKDILPFKNLLDFI